MNTTISTLKNEKFKIEQEIKKKNEQILNIDKIILILQEECQNKGHNFKKIPHIDKERLFLEGYDNYRKRFPRFTYDVVCEDCGFIKEINKMEIEINIESIKPKTKKIKELTTDKSKKLDKLIKQRKKQKQKSYKSQQEFLKEFFGQI